MFNKIHVDVLNSLTLSELDALRFIDKNKKEVLELSIQDLSKSMFVSTATIIRLCKKLGFSGYAEFKYHLKESINESDLYRKPAKFSDIIEKNINVVKDMGEMIEEKKINEVVDILSSDKNIYFFGKGLTQTILEYASKVLLSYHRKNIIFHDTHIAYLNAETMDENDVVILASLSGTTHQIIRMAQIVKSRNATLITISGSRDNELSKIGDYNFSVCLESYDHKEVDILSRAPLLVFLNIILNCYIEKNNLI